MYTIGFVGLLLLCAVCALHYGQEMRIEKKLQKLNKQPSSNQDEEPSIIENGKMNSEDYMKVLNWMMQNQIISNQEYNRMMVKGSPYLK